MANSTFNGPVRSENGFKVISKAEKTGAVTTSFTLDGNGMQNVECYRLHNHSAQCIYSAPHEYYYDFFTNNTDLSNIEVYGGWGAFYDSAQNLEVRWGGAQAINNGYWTGSGCDYYWGN